MNKIRSLCVFLVVVILLCSLTACNAIGIDVENQMRPPKNNGNQEQLQNALEAYISNNGIGQYSLKYPNEGKHLSSFILLGELESPIYVAPTSLKNESKPFEQSDDYCIAFYRPNLENAKTHIHLLKKSNDVWASIADVEGLGDAISQVDFADLNGDAFPELLIGWNMYNTKDKRLYVYDVKNNLALLSSNEIFTSLVVSDLTADSSDDLLLLNIEPTNNITSANLISYDDGQLKVLGRVEVDTNILSIGSSVTAIFSETVRGVFFDVSKDPNTTTTELILWDNGFLFAPFFSMATQMNTLTAREIAVFCQDVDEDGIVEWPTLSRLPGYENSSPEDACWKTSWFYYDHATYQAVFDFDSLISPKDGYILKLTDEFPKEFTATYDDKNRLFTLIDTTNGDEKPFLKIQTTTSNKKSDLLEGLSYFDKTDSLYFAVWYDKESDITLEKIRYLFSVL